MVQGTDWDLYVNNTRRIGYDALSPTNVLWEVKAVFLSQMANTFYRDILLPDDINQIRDEEFWAKHCGYKYILGCVDQEYADAIHNELPNIIIRMI